MSCHLKNGPEIRMYTIFVCLWKVAEKWHMGPVDIWHDGLSDMRASALYLKTIKGS